MGMNGVCNTDVEETEDRGLIEENKSLKHLEDVSDPTKGRRFIY